MARGNVRSEALQNAKKKVDELRGFYAHFFTYIFINILLFCINLITTPHEIWFYWVSIFWGLGLIAHGFSVFGPFKLLGDEWEKKKIQEILAKEKKK